MKPARKRSKKVSRPTQKHSPLKVKKPRSIKVSFYDNVGGLRIDLTGRVISETEGGRWITMVTEDVAVYNLNAIKDSMDR